MCIRRLEQKFELGIASAAFLREAISSHLPLFEFRAGYPYTHVTTVYFDTPDQVLYRQAAASYDDNDKIRLKEYYYRAHDGGYLASPDAYVELKQRRRGTVLKKRVPVPKELLLPFFAGEDIWCDVSEGVADPIALRDAYDEIREFLARRPVEPTSVIHYRRMVYQRSEARLRITFDDEIAVYEAGPDWGFVREPPATVEGVEGRGAGWRPGAPWKGTLTPDLLGPPVRLYDNVVVEIKCPESGYPQWLTTALRNHSSRRVSKFTTSVGSLVELGFRDQRGGKQGSGGETGGVASSGGGSPSPDDTQLFT